MCAVKAKQFPLKMSIIIKKIETKYLNHTKISTQKRLKNGIIEKQEGLTVLAHSHSP